MNEMQKDVQSFMKNEKGTSLINKNYEPLILRRYVHRSTAMVYFVGMICGDDLSKLDDVVLKFEEMYDAGKNLQELRNWTGALSEEIAKNFKKVEAIAVIAYADKCAISSLFGDFMNHAMCRNELYSLLNWMNGV